MYIFNTYFSGGGLSFGDVQGRFSILSISQLNLEKAILDKEFGLWTQEDNILVDKLTVLTHEKHTYILATKQNVLLIFGMNEQGIIFDQKAEYVEEYYITGYYYIYFLYITFTVCTILIHF